MQPIGYTCTNQLTGSEFTIFRADQDDFQQRIISQQLAGQGQARTFWQLFRDQDQIRLKII